MKNKLTIHLTSLERHYKDGTVIFIGKGIKLMYDGFTVTSLLFSISSKRSRSEGFKSHP